MNTTTHIQHTRSGRSALAAAIVVAVLGLAPGGLAAGASRGGKAPAKAPVVRLHPMPVGGCGTGGCFRY
jgi:hypothetical protein